MVNFKFSLVTTWEPEGECQGSDGTESAAITASDQDSVILLSLVMTFFQNNIPHIADLIEYHTGEICDDDKESETHVILPDQWFHITVACNVGYSCCSGWTRIYVKVHDTKPGTKSLSKDDDYENYSHYFMDYATVVNSVGMNFNDIDIKSQGTLNLAIGKQKAEDNEKIQNENYIMLLKLFDFLLRRHEKGDFRRSFRKYGRGLYFEGKDLDTIAKTLFVRFKFDEQRAAVKIQRIWREHRKNP